MSHRRSGWAGAGVLVLVAVSAACGGRDNVFVLDDEAPNGSGGTQGHAGTIGTGNTTFGGHGGTIGVAGHGGTIGAAGHAGTVGVGGHAGTVGVGGGVTAFGGAAGFGAVAGFGGTSGMSCAECLAMPNSNPCGMLFCVSDGCAFITKNDGIACSTGNLCAPGVCEKGDCVPMPTITCPGPVTACQVAMCDPKTGQCVNQLSTGTACDDSDPCTVNDQCTLGKCTPGLRVNACLNNDKCCPAGCTFNVDNDCAAPTQDVLLTNDRGWYQSTGLHEATNKNTLTGFSSGSKYNSYFTFDMTQVKRTITSAQLMLEQETYYGADPTETVSIWDVTTNTVLLSNTVLSVDIFNDLQSGVEYGKFTTSPNLTGTVITTTLNASALTALNAARGTTFAVGLHLDTLSGQTTMDEGVRFSASDEQRKNQLVLTLQ